MRHAFRFLLLLYPRDYRTEFGSEMLNVFEQAAKDNRDAGWAPLIQFLVAELAGMIAGAGREWMAKLTRLTGRTRRQVQVLPATQSALPDEVVEARQRVDEAIKRMVEAIASHNFERARRLSDQERIERDSLRRLYAKYNIDEASGAI